MLGICKELFFQWNENLIKYCHWKSNEHLEEGLNGKTDLDVYVAPTDRIKAEEILSQCGYIECLTQKGHRYPNVFEWIGFDSETGKLIHVHLHYQIITGTKFCKEYIFPLDDLIISTRVLDNETQVFIVDPNVEIIILYCRIALKAHKKRKIITDKNNQREIDYLKCRIDRPKLQSFCLLMMPELGRELYDLIMSESLITSDWYKVYKIASSWLKPYKKFSKDRVFFRYHYHKVRDNAIYLFNKKFDGCIINRKTFPQRSFSICFLGQDGSGKSTVTIELCKWLNWKLEAHRFYLGSGDHYNGFLKRLLLGVSKLKGGAPTQSKTTPKPKPDAFVIPKKEKKSLKNFIMAVLVSKEKLDIAKRAYKEVKRADQYRKKGGIPLFDRFPQTQFEGINDGPKIADYYKQSGLDYAIVKRMAKKERLFIEKIQNYSPHLVFKLMLSPEESIKRKPLENYNAVSKKHEIIKQLQFPNSMVVEVDATQDYQKEVLFIKNTIWKELLQNQK